MTAAASAPTSSARAADPILADLVEQFLDRIQAGEALDPTGFAAAHPEHAEPLRQLLPALEMMAALSHSAARAGTGIAPTADIAGPGLGLLGDFHILREVGRGGMGVVYEAEQVSLRRRVALKVLPFAAALDPRQLARFKSEAQATALLHHTNIVPVHAVGAERGVHYYAMQFIEGRTLADVISELRELEGKTWKSEARDIEAWEGEAPPEPFKAEIGAGRGSADPAPGTTIAGRGSPDPDPDSTEGLPSAVAPSNTLTASAERGSPDPDPGSTEGLPSAVAPSNTLTASAGRGSPDPALHQTEGLPVPPPPPSSTTRNRAYFRNVARLGLEAAQALEHAHQEGIIHRDIKPANLMVDAKGHLWVTDFGLARLKSDSGLTVSGDLLGTLRYMSPEQASGKRVVIDGRTDIYSLGVTLYELLTLEPVFEGAERQELLRRIAEDEPISPRKLNGSIPRELETILLKAMSKEPESRYETARELADDLRRFLEHRPIKARRPTLAEQAAKWARRHRTLVASAFLILVLAAAGLGASVALIARERAVAVRHRDQTRHHRYVADIRQAYELVQAGQGPAVLELLNKWRPVPGEPDVRNFAWYYLRRLCHDERLTFRGHAGAVYHAEFSPDGRALVSCGQDGTVRFWDVATGRPLRTIAAHATDVNGAAFSPDGRTLATVSDDGTIKLWDVETAAEQATIRAHKGEATAVRFTPDGARLISAGRNDCLIKLWDRATLREIAATRAHEVFIENVALAPDGTTLATAGADGYARLWNLADLSVLKSIHAALDNAVYGLALSSDGTRLATSDAGGHVRMWDLPSGEPRSGFQSLGHFDGAQAVAFVAGDRMVVSADRHAVLRLSDATTGTNLGTLHGHTGKIWGISVSPDATSFATVNSDGTVKLWDARLPQRWLAIPVPNAGGPLAFTPDGQTLVVADVASGRPFVPPNGAPTYRVDANLEVSGFDAKTGARRFHRVLERGQKSYGPRLTTDAALALFVLEYNTVAAWEVATGKRLATIDHLRPIDRSRLVGVHATGKAIELIDALTGQRHTLKGTESEYFFASAPEAKLVALRTGDRLAMWDLATAQVRRTRRGVSNGWNAATFSPNATILAAGATSPRGEIQLWEVETLELIDSLPGHPYIVDDLDFSPDGRVLASLGRDAVELDGVLKLWDVGAHVELLTLRGPFQPSPALRFTPDGQTLAFRASAEGKAWVYLLSTALPEGPASEEAP